MKRLLAIKEGTPEQLATLIWHQPKLLLMTDYDGTLVPIRDKPEYAVPNPKLLNLLQDMAGQENIILAIISGRDLNDLRALLPIKGLYMAGCHGAEFLYPEGKKYLLPHLVDRAHVLATIAQDANRQTSGKKGFLLEIKKAAVALHYRLANPADVPCILASYISSILPIIEKNKLEIVVGKKVIEVRPRGINKGEAVKHLLALHHGYYPVYLGDDTTDEDAFSMLRSYGAGVLIGPKQKLTSANYFLKNPKNVLRFMQIIATRCSN